MKNLRFSGQLVHHLLCRQVESNNPEVLEFNFGGSAVRFTKWEFALISGLKFCRYPSMYDLQISKGNELRTRLLDDRSDLKPPELERLFKDTLFVDDWDVVRIALLYFLVHGVLGMDPKVQIKKKFIDLVADLDVFNSYPWGILSYKETINSFHNAFQLRGQGRAVKNISQYYDLKGFPLVFQVWGFEAIPDFGNQFADRLETRCPRILGWHTPRQPNHFTVHNWFSSNSNYVVHWTLDATDEEKTMDYWRTIAVDIHEVRYTSPPIVAPIVGAKDASKAGEHSSGPPDSNFRLACLEAKVDELNKEMAALKKMLSSVIDQQKHQAEHHMHSHSPSSYMTVGKEFFAELLTDEGWLNSDHIDTILYFIRKRRFDNEKMFTNTCAILDVLFWSSIKGRYPIWSASRSTYSCDATLCNYVHGRSPKPSVSWRICDYVYIPVNNGGAHWLAACVDLKARHIDLYDPNMGNKYVQNRELKNAECLTYMLPYLLRDGGYYGKNPDVSPTLDPFTMTMIKDAPRQDNGGDCGVYALKFIEYMSSEENPSFGPQDIMFFRKKYAVDLYFNKLSM